MAAAVNATPIFASYPAWRMHRSIRLGLPALACAASCVPVANPATQPVARPVAEGHALLRRLALDVPKDLADVPPAAMVPSPVAPIIAAPPFLPGAQAAEDAGRAAECLTAAVYYEARSEAPDGQRAVAQVVLNRVRDRAFPASVCGVVYQGAARRTGCQFSFTCDGSMDRPREPRAWDRARAIAVAALAGAVYAPIGSATYYHADSVLPWWAPSLSRIGAIGAHVFYRWRGRMEGALAFRQSYAGEEPRLAPGGAASAPAGWPGAATVMGVAIHYGTPVVTTGPADAKEARAGEAVDRGVTVHRASAPAGIVRAAAASAGVRVHRGIAGDAVPPSDGSSDGAGPV